jgi:hypothetical protein
MGRGSVGRDILGLRTLKELMLARGSLAPNAKRGSDGFLNHLEGFERRWAKPEGELERP